jgi:geranylgeranyl reductase family protein
MYDVIVVGAGPGGSSAAYFLAQRGLCVLLLDKADFPRDKTCGDGLTPRAVSVLQTMGLADELRRIGHLIRRFEVFAPDGRSTGDTIAIGAGLPDYALVVPRLQLDDCIRQRAVQAGAHFQAGVHVDDVRAEPENGTVRVQVLGERMGRRALFHAQMAVVATGANPQLLRRLGLLSRSPQFIVAARAYFEGVNGLGDAWTLRFDGAPLPGYGWIFPVAPDVANIGVGYFRHARAASAVRPFEAFIRGSALRALLEGARQCGPVKGYPLRDDFLTSPTYGQRILLVGEAAGLVNPLTGEGIDYALESGQVAAEHAAAMIASGDFSDHAHAAYDRALRERYQALFAFCTTVRAWCVRPFMLNLLVRMANRRHDLRRQLTRVVLGGAPVRGRLTLRRAMRALLGI